MSHYNEGEKERDTLSKQTNAGRARERWGGWWGGVASRVSINTADTFLLSDVGIGYMM